MRKFVFILTIVHSSLLITNCLSQQPTQEWVARYTGPYNDLYGPFLAVDKQGNSYIAGTHVVNDTPKVLCVKYNTDGIQQWAALYIYPGEAYIRPSGLALDSSGNAYVIADQGPAYYLPTNGLIAKFNSINGSLVWAKRYIGQYGWGSFLDIKIDRLNNIYAVGWTDTSHLVIRYNTNGDSVWVRKYHLPSTAEDARACTIDDSLNVIFTGRRRFSSPPDSLLAAKYSAGGVLRWESVYAFDNLVNVGTKITSDQNGNLYIGGVTRVSGLGVYLTLKYDRNGTRQWAKIYYGVPLGGDNNLRGIAMDRINNALFVTGGAITNGIQMATTIKYNTTTGDSLWVRKDTGTYKYGDARDIKIDTSGNIYITGVTSSTGSGAPVDILTLKYTLQGIRVWLMTFNGPFNGLDIGRALGLDEQNNVYVLGTSQSGFQISDYVLIKYNQILGIKPISNEIPNAYKLFQNYPNPFNSTTIIRFMVPIRDLVQIQIYDILGRIIEIPLDEKISAAEYELRIDAAKYSSGVYFYRMVANNNIIDTKKFIIVK